MYIDIFLAQFTGIWQKETEFKRACEGAKYLKLYTYINQPKRVHHHIRKTPNFQMSFRTQIANLKIKELTRMYFLVQSDTAFHGLHILPFQIKTKTFHMKFVDVFSNAAFQYNLNSKQIRAQSYILFVKTSKKIFAFLANVSISIIKVLAKSGRPKVHWTKFAPFEWVLKLGKG